MGRTASRAKIGDRATSDVVVRLRTHEGRDHWFYCHSRVLTDKSRYFADRLSDDWPTCQILGSRYCVEVYCQEPEFSAHVNALRLLYADEPYSRYGVRSTLGILQAAVHLGCHEMACACLDYLESAPWDEADEDEILKTVPRLGPQYERILARLRPIDPAPAASIFLSAFRHATSCPTGSVRVELKSAAQEQLEYMLAEDDDAPLLAFDDDTIKPQVENCVTSFLARLSDFMDSVLTRCPQAPAVVDVRKELHSFLSDVLWLCQILSKVKLMKGLIHYWVSASSNIVEVVELLCAQPECLKTRLKVIEVTAKVLEAITFGSVVVPTEKRRNVVDIWIRFARRTKPLAEQFEHDDEEAPSITVDSEVWQVLESAIVSIVLMLPSGWQAEILSEWLQSKNVRYPDLTEVFEVWCYRSKVARQRLSFLGNINKG